MCLRLPLLAVFIATLAGCINPSDFETPPVIVVTPQGPITCQLYTHRQVVWDRAIDRPANVSVAEADRYCIDEGYRRLKSGT